MIINVLELILYLITKKELKLIHYIMYLVVLGIISLMASNSHEIFLTTMASIFAIFPILITEIKSDDN